MTSPSNQAATIGSDAVTISGVISGNGDLIKTNPIIAAPGQTAFSTVVLTGAGGSYTGDTTVTGGQLVVAAHNALPTHTHLTVSDQFTLAPGFDQTVGQISSPNGNSSGFINIGAGSTLTSDTSSSNTIGRLSGSGTLYLTGGGTTDGLASNNNGTNWNYSGNIVVDGSQLNVAGAGYLGVDGYDGVNYSSTLNTLTLQNGGIMYMTGRYNSGRAIIIGTGGGTIDENTQTSTSMDFGYTGITGPGLLTEKGSVVKLLVGGKVDLPGGMDLQGQGVILSDYGWAAGDSTIGPVTGSGQLDKQKTNNVNVYSMNLSGSNGGVQLESGSITMQPRSVTGSNHPVYLTYLYNPGGTLNLNDNDLVVNDGTSYNSFSSIKAEVAGGQITSSPSSVGGHPTLLVLFDNALVGDTAWAGQTISSTAVVGKYTFYGDVNLDGQVTGDDYSAVDSNLGATGLNAGNAWLLGDTNGDLQVTGDDYTTIDANLGAGVGNPLAVASVSAVPEPASLGMLGLGAMGLLARRRRRRSR